MRKRIGFIGNAKSGKEPFGVVADLRIFPHALSQRQVQELSFLRHARDPNMPDNHLVKFLEEGIPQQFIYMIREESASTNIKILAMLACFATKTECKAELLRWDILDIVLPLQKHDDTILRLGALKLINSLI